MNDRQAEELLYLLRLIAEGIATLNVNLAFEPADRGERYKAVADAIQGRITAIRSAGR